MWADRDSKLIFAVEKQVVYVSIKEFLCTNYTHFGFLTIIYF